MYKSVLFGNGISSGIYYSNELSNSPIGAGPTNLMIDCKRVSIIPVKKLTRRVTTSLKSDNPSNIISRGVDTASNY